MLRHALLTRTLVSLLAVAMASTITIGSKYRSLRDERIKSRPALALNTASLQDPVAVLKIAFDAGFRRIDFHPGPERDAVREAIRQSDSIDRRELWLTTKS